MGLLDRVMTLIRANLNDLVDRAEDPEKMMKQVMLDMRNQLLQVKTQVAMSLADQHLLEQKQREHETASADWMRKAEMAVQKGKEDLARQALERHENESEQARSFAQQVEDQKQQVDNLKTALHRLELKLVEAQAKADVLLAQNRRSRAAVRAADAHSALADGSAGATFDRIKDRVMRQQALGTAKNEMLAEQSVEDQFTAMDRQERIEALLTEIKQRKQLTA